MKSDIYIVKIELTEGFEEQIKEICVQQASREEPRKLVSIVQIIDELILVFELA